MVENSKQRMLPTMSEAITLALLLAAASRVLRATRRLRHTTLAPAAGWLAGGLLLWAAATAGTLLGGLPPSLADAGHYVTATLLLAPPVVVLGARRPTTRVWTAFVLVPMLLVLNWSVAARLWRQSWSLPLELTPASSSGFLIVLAMGYGNYVLTLWSGPVLLAASALAGVVLSLTPVWRPAAIEPGTLRSLCGGAYALAVLWAEWVARRRLWPLLRDMRRSPIERLWIEFSQCFGVVWAVRIAERLNKTGREHGWPVRFEPFGIVPAVQAHTCRQDERGNAAVRLENPCPAGSAPLHHRIEQAAATIVISPAVYDDIEHTLRWLLRRFVDPQWLDERFGRAAAPAQAGTARGS